MQRQLSKMTATALEAFMERWELTRAECAQRLGVKERGLYAMLNGDRPITMQLAILIKALDELWTIKRNTEKRR